MKEKPRNTLVLITAIGLMVIGIWALTYLPHVNWHAIQSDSTENDAPLHQYPRPLSSVLPKHPNDSWEDIKDKER